MGERSRRHMEEGEGRGEREGEERDRVEREEGKIEKGERIEKKY